MGAGVLPDPNAGPDLPEDGGSVRVTVRHLAPQFRMEMEPLMSNSTIICRVLAKVLGIKLDRSDNFITQSDSVIGISNAAAYVEQEPTVSEFLREHIPGWNRVLQYFLSLFPFLKWIGHYNFQWFLGDVVAGITVGAVVVPQGMAYASLAAVAPQFGLYSSFMGVVVYWFFATSKDITIGPTAVLAAVTGNTVLEAKKALPDVHGYEIASALGVVAGAIVCFLGLIRVGWIVELISLTAISAFMTGSALSICTGQVHTLLGLPRSASRQPMYKVALNALKNLHQADTNAAVGISALALLYAIRGGCNWAAARYPNKRKIYFFLATMRSVFIILLFTFISYLANRNNRKHPKFKIVGAIPRGFRDTQIPKVTTPILKVILPNLPAAVIVLLLEHISIGKSFGRINNYTIEPSQELVAIGVTNILGPFLGSFPATGSFSRTAIQAKAGSRTPFAGVITAGVVLLAIYALTAIFFYVPSASLSAVIIHALGDLITSPNTLYQFWRVSPLEVFIFFLAVFVAIFTRIEKGIYAAVSASVAVLLFRIFKAKGHFLGKVKVHSVIGDHVIEEGESRGAGKESHDSKSERAKTRDIFLPVNHRDGSNPDIYLPTSPAPGIFIFRFSEGYSYPSASHYLDFMVQVILKHTRRTQIAEYHTAGDHPWNDPNSRTSQIRSSKDAARSHLPTLRAVILDFSSVNHVDVTSVQQLIDVRNQLDRHAAPSKVDWHFAHLYNRWTKRALASAGFGFPSPQGGDSSSSQIASADMWAPIFSVAELSGLRETDGEYHNGNVLSRLSISGTRESVVLKRENGRMERLKAAEEGKVEHMEHADLSTFPGSSIGIEMTSVRKEEVVSKREAKRHALVHGINRPLFHVDLVSALQSAMINARRRERHLRLVSVVVEAGDE